MKKPDLLILVAIWDFLHAFVMLIGLLAIGIFAIPAVIATTYGIDRAAAIFGLGIALVFIVAILAVALAAGIGLLQGKNWGRVLSIVVAAAGLLSMPVGTVVGILIIIYLTRQDVKDYFLPHSV
jgi:hypothetical protein